MKHGCKKIITVILLLAYILFFAIGTDSSLLCFGSEGHIAVEWVQSCNGKAEFGSSVSPLTPQDECGPCYDVTFLSDPVIQKAPQNHDNNAGVAVASKPAPELSAKSHLTDNAPRYSNYHPAPSYFALKTVVILI